MEKLAKISTEGNLSLTKEELKEETKRMVKRIGLLQYKMYAQGKHSLLVVIQGMDASGKDGTIRRVFGKINPAGVSVKSFKKPTEEEFSHDFLWRIHKEVPPKGGIKIFNRSHYEDILVPSVMGYYSKEEIELRYEQINAFERHLEQNGTKVLKFYLHVSKEVQLERLEERISNPEKHWKHNDGDWETRESWEKYMGVYEKLFERCNRPTWNIIPADKNSIKVYLIAAKVLEHLEKLPLEWPKLETEKFLK